MDALGSGVVGFADAPVVLDTTIAILIVLTNTVSHAINKVQGFAEQLVPMAVEGDDDWVCYASSGMTGIVGRSDLHDVLQK